MSFDIGKALGDAAGNPTIPVGQLLNYAVGVPGQANPLAGPVDFRDFFKNGSDVFGGLAKGSLDGLETILKKFLKEITAAGGDGLDDIYKGFVQLVAKAFAEAIEAILDALAKAVHDLQGSMTAIGKAFLNLCDELIQAIGKLGDDFWREASKLLADLATVLRNFLDQLLQYLLEKLKAFDVLPGPLKCGPMDAALSAKQMFDLVARVDVDAQAHIEARVDAVVNSLKALFKLAVDSETLATRFIFGAFFDRWGDLIKAVIHGESIATVWEKFALADFILSKDVLLGVIDAFAKQKLWAWIDLPCGLRAGQFHEWINGAGAGVALEREFRIRLVAALETFAAAKIGVVSLDDVLTDIDRADMPTVVSGLILVILDTMINFVLEPECLAILDADLDGIEDLGLRLGVTLSGQIQVSIRGAISLLLRGISVFSIRNEVLIELVGALIAGLFGPMIEGVVRNLTWTFRVVTAYPNADVGAEVVVHRWQSLEVVSGTNQPLEFLLLIRTPPDGAAPAINIQDFDKALGLFQDLGALIDLSYRRFRYENRFPAIAHPDVVTIVDARVVDGKLTVTARTEGRFGLPQPVLRLYYCCEMVVMQPGADPDQSYFVQVPVARKMRINEVTVLSNRGGVARHPLARA